MTKSTSHFLIADKDEYQGIESLLNFKKTPANFIQVNTAADCLKLVFQKNIQMVVIDDNLPDLPGLTLVSLLKKMKPDLEIIFITPDHDAKKEIDARLAGILYYAVKPIDWTLLGEIIERALTKQNKKLLLTDQAH